MSVIVTSRGRVTIPKPFRDLLGIVPGMRVDFRRNSNGEVVLVIAGQTPPSRFARLLGHAGEGLSTDEVMALTRGE